MGLKWTTDHATGMHGISGRTSRRTRPWTSGDIHKVGRSKFDRFVDASDGFESRVNGEAAALGEAAIYSNVRDVSIRIIYQVKVW